MIGYPSDITCQQFELIQPNLEAVCRRTRPRQVDLYAPAPGILVMGLNSGKVFA